MSESKNEEAKNENIFHFNAINKYNSTAQRCVDSCLNYGEIRHINMDGSAMKVEIPQDKYEEAVRDIEKRIFNKETSPNVKIEDAVELLKKGNVTYTQAKTLAKEGKIEGLSYYEIDGSIESDGILGLSGMVEYALAIWDGLSREEALIKGITRTMRVFDTYFIDCLKISDESKKDEYKRFVKSNNITENDEEIKLYRYPTSSINYENMYNSIDIKNYKKNSLVNTSEIVGTITNAIFSSTDMKNVLLGDTSSKSFIKKIIVILLGILGGTLGWIFGSYVGGIIASIIPFIPLKVASISGGIIASLLIVMIFIGVSRLLLDRYIKDDAKEIIDIFNQELQIVEIENMLTSKEVSLILKHITNDNIPNLLRGMKGSVNKRVTASTMINKECRFILDARKHIVIPSEHEIINILDSLVYHYRQKLNSEYSIETV
jgi:hypothetical protein